MNWLYPTVAAVGGLVVKRQITRYWKRLTLTRLAIDWRDDDNISMTVRDGLGKKYTVNQMGAYWYKGQRKEENRVDSALNKALTKLKFAYLDEVRRPPKNNG